jgi:hypothetical protein
MKEVDPGSTEVCLHVCMVPPAWTFAVILMVLLLSLVSMPPSEKSPREAARAPPGVCHELVAQQDAAGLQIRLDFHDLPPDLPLTSGDKFLIRKQARYLA